MVRVFVFVVVMLQVWVTASTKMGEGPPSDVVLVKPSHTGEYIALLNTVTFSQTSLSLVYILTVFKYN